VRLQPANPTMAPIFVHPSNLEIQGKVIAVIRHF
jgi:SOS-response transcriptional repressor LexA